MYTNIALHSIKIPHLGVFGMSWYIASEDVEATATANVILYQATNLPTEDSVPEVGVSRVT